MNSCKVHLDVSISVLAKVFREKIGKRAQRVLIGRDETTRAVNLVRSLPQSGT